MIVYHHGSPDKPPVETHTLIVCPAKHLPSHCPEDFWWDNTGETKRALEFQVTFHYGEAEVEDQLGRYLVATGMAKRHPLHTVDCLDAAPGLPARIVSDAPSHPRRRVIGRL
jgi:hypothetical protein